MVIAPAMRRRRPPSSTSPPASASRHGTPSAYPMGTVAIVVGPWARYFRP